MAEAEQLQMERRALLFLLGLLLVRKVVQPCFEFPYWTNEMAKNDTKDGYKATDDLLRLLVKVPKTEVAKLKPKKRTGRK